MLTKVSIQRDGARECCILDPDLRQDDKLM